MVAGFEPSTFGHESLPITTRPVEYLMHLGNAATGYLIVCSKSY